LGRVRAKGAASYEALAGCYDRLFRLHHAAWRRARRELLKRVPFRITSLCDLACGTGTAALEFARRGVRVTAVDLSAAMCRSVRRKARREGVCVRVMHADMRSFHLPERVDLVTCCFHSLNHLFTERDFRRALQRVREALRPGGYFFFDCAHAKMYEAASSDRSYLDAGDFFLVRGYEFDSAHQKAHYEATWFVRRGAHWQRFVERIPQVPWPDVKVRAMLRQEGFALTATHDSARFVYGPEARGGRNLLTFYLARRK